MKPSQQGETWSTRLLGPRIPWSNSPVRPADVGDALCTAMLSRENILEDAKYQKIAPNRYIVEVSQDNFLRNYQPLEAQILKQWNDKLVAHLLTTNNRQGRAEYRFIGPVKIEIRPVGDLRKDQARILCRVQVEESGYQPAGKTPLAACLEASGGRRWSLHAGILTIGRNENCDIYLDTPDIQQKKLVSSLHAYMNCQEGSYHLFDGAPDGRSSLNGTFVNLLRLPPAGVELKDADLIILAALDPDHPTPETPGAAVLRFRIHCTGRNDEP